MIDLILGHINGHLGAGRSLMLCADRNKQPVRVWIEEEVCASLPSIADRWQGAPANGTYGQMLTDCSTRKLLVLETQCMPPCLLRDKYRAQGIKQSVVVSLGHQELGIYRYLSINFLEVADRDLDFVRSAAHCVSLMIARLDLR